MNRSSKYIELVKIFFSKCKVSNQNANSLPPLLRAKNLGIIIYDDNLGVVQ